MKRNIILLLSLLLICGGILLAKEEIILKVKVQTANVRSEPDAAAPVIAKVNSGTLLEASGRDGAWYEITITNQAGREVSGFIHNSVVIVMSGGEEEEEEETRPAPAARRQEADYRESRKEFASGGLKLLGGLSMGNLNVSADVPDFAKKTAKWGFMGGLGYESGGRFAFELDVLYSPGGCVFKPLDAADKRQLAFSANAISMPIMVKVRVMPGTTPYVLAGGEVGYILKETIVATAEDGVTTTETDVTDNINRLLIGLVFGGGIEIKASGLSLLLEARYRLGLSNQLKDPDPGEYTKVTSLIFTLGVKF